MAQARCLAVTPAITGVRQCEKARERMQLKKTSGERIVKNRRTFVHKNRTRPTRRGGNWRERPDHWRRCPRVRRPPTVIGRSRRSLPS